MSKTLVGERDPFDRLPEVIVADDTGNYSKYASINSVNADRSFSVYKNISVLQIRKYQ